MNLLTSATMLSVPIAEDLTAVQLLLQEQLKHAKEAYKADGGHAPKNWSRNQDQVWLSTRDQLRKGRCRKLDPQHLSLFEVVEQINSVTFCLHLPPSMKIHLVLHRSLLSLPTQPYQPERHHPPPIIVDGEQEYEVEQILDT